MLVELSHPRFHSIEQTNESLLLHGRQITLPLYTNKILESTVTLSGPIIYSAALVKEDTIRYWYGDENFRSEELKVDGGVIRGAKLVTDFTGVPHLFYLLYNYEFKRTGCTLIHRIFQSNRWSDPIRVTTNINSFVDNWQVCFDVNHYLHLIYLNQEKDILFYRCIDLKTKSCSGAIPLVKEECDNPQIYIDSMGITIFWISIFEKSRSLKVIQKEIVWGKPYELSPKSNEVYQPAFNLSANSLTVMWIQDGKLWESNYSKQQWSQPKAVPKAEYELYYQTVMADDKKGCCTFHLYRPKNTKILETRAVPDKKDNQIQNETSKDAQKSVSEKKFIQEVFKLQQEWRLIKAEYQKVPDFKAEVTAQIKKIEARVSRYRSFDLQVNNLESRIIKLETAVNRILHETSTKISGAESSKSIFHRILSRFKNNRISGI